MGNAERDSTFVTDIEAFAENGQKPEEMRVALTTTMQLRQAFEGGEDMFKTAVRICVRRTPDGLSRV